MSIKIAFFYSERGGQRRDNLFDLQGRLLALSRKPLSQKVLWGIAICNAAGCYIATSGGSLGAQYLMNDQTTNGIACLAFVYLAIKEYMEASDNGSLPQDKPKQVSLDLALPMTVNNLAGGVTAGVLGVSPV